MTAKPIFLSVMNMIVAQHNVYKRKGESDLFKDPMGKLILLFLKLSNLKRKYFLQEASDLFKIEKSNPS